MLCSFQYFAISVFQYLCYASFSILNVCTHTPTHTSHLHSCAYTNPHTHTHRHARTHSHIHIYTHTHTHTTHTHTHMNTHEHIETHTSIQLYIYNYICVHELSSFQSLSYTQLIISVLGLTLYFHLVFPLSILT